MARERRWYHSRISQVIYRDDWAEVQLELSQAWIQVPARWRPEMGEPVSWCGYCIEHIGKLVIGERLVWDMFWLADIYNPAQTLNSGGPHRQ